MNTYTIKVTLTRHAATKERDSSKAIDEFILYYDTVEAAQLAYTKIIMLDGLE